MVVCKDMQKILISKNAYRTDFILFDRVNFSGLGVSRIVLIRGF